jgi:hypothetical protein
VGVDGEANAGAELRPDRYYVCFASYVGYDEAQDALARTCAPELRARGLTDELGACLLGDQCVLRR